MPTYEYICENCGYEFDRFQSIKAAPLRKCPKCSKPTLKRLISSGAGIIFKGSGFYQTDYRSEKYKTAEKNDKKTAEKIPEIKSEAKNTKPDKKTKHTPNSEKTD